MPGVTDLASPRFKAAAYPFYARLREETPVFRVRLRGGYEAWLISRYGDVLAALKDERFVKSRDNAQPEKRVRRPWIPGALQPLTRNMLDLDPPDHTRLRALVHRGFTPRRIEQLHERIRALTHELLESSAGRGRLDLVRDYALPLPTTIIAELLGIPVDDRHRFHRWSAAIVSVNLSRWTMVKAIPSGLAFLRYIRRLVRARREQPGDDLVSALAQVEEAGEQLSEDELVAMMFLLLVAGHETTVNLIANGVLALLEHPDQMGRLRDHRELMGTAIEEMLRYYSPVELATERYAREHVSLHERTIPRGALVYAVLASANRDERLFPAAAAFDIGRDPNRHLAFGQGIHFCLGAPLARIEDQIAVDTLLERSAEIRLAVPRTELRWKRGLNLRGLRSLPVEVIPA